MAQDVTINGTTYPAVESVALTDVNGNVTMYYADAVRYVEQVLTEEQKMQTRFNIGAASKSGWTANMIIGTDANGNMVARATYTEAEKQELMDEIIDNIKIEMPEAHVIYGDVDSQNNITLYGELEKGTYTLKYEDADGKVTEIGSLKVGSTFTNQIPISTDTDGSIYNGTGYKINTRMGSSGTTSEFNPKISGLTPFATGFIPVKQGDVIRLKNCFIEVSNTINYEANGGTGYWGIRSGLYNSSKAKVEVVSWGQLIDGDQAKFSNYTNVNGKITEFTIAYSGIAYVRLTLATNGNASDAIVTVNEEID